MPETGRDGARAMVAVDLHDEAAAAYEARNELGPQCEHAVLESFVASAAEAIDQRADAGWHSKGSTRPHRSSMTEPAPAGVSGRLRKIVGWSCGRPMGFRFVGSTHPRVIAATPEAAMSNASRTTGMRCRASYPLPASRTNASHPRDHDISVSRVHELSPGWR